MNKEIRSMSAKIQRSAFTLIEVLIVVVIMAVLAATIIPQFASSTEDAKTSSAKFNLHTLRSQVEMYKLQHGGTPPTLAALVDSMTKSTDATGAVGTAGPTFPFGPYIQGTTLPPNPYDGKTTVSATATSPPTAATAAGGWLYHAASGQIYINNADHYTD
jgi:general secretion pathway protein G